MYDLVILFIIYYIDFQNFLYIIYFICIFHSTRVNLRAMILRGSAGSVCHLENVKSCMSYLQQCTKIIKCLPSKLNKPARLIVMLLLSLWFYFDIQNLQLVILYLFLKRKLSAKPDLAQAVKPV
jgi:hypothetical protein